MPDLAEARVEHRVVVAGRDAGLDLGARQRHLAILADELAVRADQHGDVVDEMLVALDEPGDQVQAMLARQFAEVIGGRPGDRLRRVAIGEAVAGGGDRLGQHHQVGLLPRGLFDERRELAATVHRRLPAVRDVMHRRQPHLARRGRLRLGEDDARSTRPGRAVPSADRVPRWRAWPLTGAR